MAKATASEAYQAPGAPPRIVGYMTTRILHTEREALLDDGEGMTIGNMVDRQIDRIMKDPFEG
jgi:hypothetical protein